MRPLLPTDPPWVGGYRILGRLGAGGMGMVLLGRSPGGALAAIKLIRAEFADDAAFRARFRREVAIARRVDNRWAVPVVDADTDADAPWLATAFVPGPSLSEAVAPGSAGQGGALPERSVRALGVMLGEALEAVHATGLVHRDVKPGNVLLAADGPRLIDFGIARSLDDTVLTTTDMVVGSPGFLSPEQAQARPVGPPSDLFSLGCVLAFAASGERPFGSGPADALLFRTVHHEPDLSRVPAALRPMVARCLEKDPELRPDAASLRRSWQQEGAAEAAEGWLPPETTHLIATRSATMLALPEADPTELAGPPEGGPRPSASHPPGLHDAVTAYGPGPATVQEPSPGRGRRRVLGYLGGAAGLVLAGGGGLWLSRRAGGGPPAGDGAGAGSAPVERPLLRVGVQADLSGELADAARAQQAGAELAVAHLNAEASHPFRYELSVTDDEGDPEAAVEAAEGFAEDDAVIAVLGATGAEAARTSLAAYEAARLPLVSVTDGTPSHMNSVFLSARSNDSYQLVSVLAHLTQRDRGVIALVDTGTPYSRVVVQGVRQGLRTGGQPVLPVSLPEDGADHREDVRALVAQGPGAVLYGGGWSGLADFARALDESGYQGLRLATHAAFDRRLPERAGDAAEGWLLVAAVVDATAVDSARGFTADYREIHGAPPPPFAAEAYDVIRLLAGCAERLGQERVDRQDIRATLRASEHRGVAKEYRFEEDNGTFVGEGTFFYRVVDGDFHFLGTEPPEDD